MDLGPWGDLTILAAVLERWEAGPQGGPLVTRHRDCNEPVHVELRCAHDHRIFEAEETQIEPRPDLVDTTVTT